MANKKLERCRDMYNCHFPWLSASIIRGKESLLFSEVVLKFPIIDLGCGNGQFAKLTFNEKIDFGVDIVISKNLNNYTYSNWMKQDLRKMTFDDNSFYTAVSNSVFEHIDGVESAISEVARILKKRGRLYLNLPTQEINKNFWLYRMFGKRKFVDKAIVKYHQNLFHINIKPASWWKEILERNSFTVTNIRKYISPPTMFFITMFVTLAMSPLPIKRYKCMWGIMKLIGDISHILPFIKFLLYILTKILWIYSGCKDSENGCYVFVEAVKNA